MKNKNRHDLFGLNAPDGYIKCSCCPAQGHKELAFKLGWQELYSGGTMKWYCPECVEMEKTR